MNHLPFEPFLPTFMFTVPMKRKDEFLSILKFAKARQWAAEHPEGDPFAIFWVESSWEIYGVLRRIAHSMMEHSGSRHKKENPHNVVNHQSIQAPKFDVKRIRKENGGSYIDPPLDENWSDLVKLGWHACVVSLDADLPPIKVYQHPHNYQVENSSTGGFHRTWALINGIEIGARLARRKEEL